MATLFSNLSPQFGLKAYRLLGMDLHLESRLLKT